MMSRSLSLAASPLACEPKRMIRLGWAAWTSTPVTFETISLVAGLKANTTPTTSLPQCRHAIHTELSSISSFLQYAASKFGLQMDSGDGVEGNRWALSL